MVRQRQGCEGGVAGCAGRFRRQVVQDAGCAGGGLRRLHRLHRLRRLRRLRRRQVAQAGSAGQAGFEEHGRVRPRLLRPRPS